MFEVLTNACARIMSQSKSHVAAFFASLLLLCVLYDILVSRSTTVILLHVCRMDGKIFLYSVPNVIFT